MPLSTHTYHEIFLHVNWHCLGDRPLLNPAIESECHEFIRDYCRRTRGVLLLGIGGTETHLHLAIRIEPFVNAAELIGKLKGASSHELNRRLGAGAFHWQRGYGVVSFAKKNLAAVLEYISRQKEHHASGQRLNAILESTGSDVAAETWGAEACEKPR